MATYDLVWSALLALLLLALTTSVVHGLVRAGRTRRSTRDTAVRRRAEADDPRAGSV